MDFAPMAKTMRNFYFDKEIYAISESVSVLAGALADGARIIQFRDKVSPPSMIARKAAALISLKERHDFTFIINDDPELALRVGADGVHIGQDFDTATARGIIGRTMILGKTTHRLTQARDAAHDGADYVSAGPVFATPTKPGRQPVGLAYIEEISRANLPIPFVAIGGIDLSNIDELMAAGANTIGIVRATDQIKEMLCRLKG